MLAGSKAVGSDSRAARPNRGLEDMVAWLFQEYKGILLLVIKTFILARGCTYAHNSSASCGVAAFLWSKVLFPPQLGNT